MTFTKTVIVTDTNQFDAVLKETITNNPNSTVLGYFTGAVNPATNKSWCPDCVVSEPILNDLLEEFENNAKNPSEDKIILIKCPIERAGYSGNPNHPYRKNPSIKLTGVPTLIWYQDNSPTDRLVEGDFTSGDKVNKYRSKVAKAL
ncbi:thioredoxin domain-containing protein [Acrasis kona]|uniref:Thioredoxin domain-containing protein n=1 Tax=Acrasis kona TaxID=1008807 RepID=A0AAW2YTY2_9EUKA